MAPTPAATPSMLSSRLKAFVRATNQNKVNPTLATYPGDTSSSPPKLSSVAPASSCSTNLSWARRRTTSSSSPTRNQRGAEGDAHCRAPENALDLRPVAGPEQRGDPDAD